MIRHWYGLAADNSAVQSVEQMLYLLAGSDIIAECFGMASLKIAVANVA